MLDDKKTHYTVAQAAIELKLTEQTIRRMIRSGKLLAEKVGRSYVISASDLEWKRDKYLILSFAKENQTHDERMEEAMIEDMKRDF